MKRCRTVPGESPMSNSINPLMITRAMAIAKNVTPGYSTNASVPAYVLMMPADDPAGTSPLTKVVAEGTPKEKTDDSPLFGWSKVAGAGETLPRVANPLMITAPQVITIRPS